MFGLPTHLLVAGALVLVVVGLLLWRPIANLIAEAKRQASLKPSAPLAAKGSSATGPTGDPLAEVKEGFDALLVLDRIYTVQGMSAEARAKKLGEAIYLIYPGKAAATPAAAKPPADGAKP